jgi:sugar (pentulose or hexulose) kinase
MARAMLEAVAFDLRTIVGVMRKKLTLAEHVVLTGGLARSPIIPQLLADVLDAEIQVPTDGEGSIAGAAILALNGLGAIPALSFIGEARTAKAYRPDAANRECYHAVYAGYTRLVDQLREINLNERNVL